MDMPATDTEEFRRGIVSTKNEGTNFIMHKVIKRIMTIPAMMLMTTMMARIVTGNEK